MEYVNEVVRLKQVVCESEMPMMNINSSFVLAQWLEQEIGNESQEVFIVFCLDIKNKVNSFSQVTRGTVNQSIAHPRDVFQRALLSNASRIIIAHNHPSGVVKPSNNDEETTKRIKQAGDLLGVQLLDHLIVTDDSYYSFREEQPQIWY